MANLSSLILQRNSIQQQITTVEAELDIARRNTPALVSGLQSQLIQLEAELISIQAQIDQLQSSTASAGTIVQDDALATAENSSAQRPPVTNLVLDDNGRIVERPDTVSGTTALPPTFLENVDSGTDADLRPLIETQSTNLGDNEQGGPLLLNPEIDGRENDFSGAMSIDINGVGGRPGVGAGSDDFSGKNSTRVEIDSVFDEAKIIPQPNITDQYASYTYNASLYLMSADDYQRMINSRHKVLNGAQLLMASGGAPVNGRNQFFTNDYYIDKIEIRSAITGKGTNAAHNANTIKFSVIEPNGITLIGNLDRAVQAYLGSAETKKKNFASQMYLLVIRFYGYDANGNLVRGGVPRPDGSSDPNAFVEKWYPIAINSINFKVANKLVEYEIAATSPSYQVAAGSSRGSIPYNVELSGTTVKDILSGPVVFTNTAGTTQDTTTPAPAKASAAPTVKKTVRQGLMTAMNEFQQQLVRDGIYTHPDVYSIEFINPSIEQAKIKNKGSTDKSKVANSTSKSAADQKVGAKQSVDTTSKISTITAGSQLVQVIDQIVRNSSYLEDQQLVIFDPNTQKEIPNGSAANNLAYFKIGLQAVPYKYDPKRNDYAYQIKYTVNVYRINESASNYFYVPTFKGVHKQYNYWFTGENSQVLNYEQDLNTLYTSVLSGGSSSPATIYNDAIKFNFAPGSGESRQGANGKVNEPKANLADYLFNPGDLAKATLQIVGDPAWLQQGEAFAGIGKTNPFYFRSFLQDGTINFESQQILFEVLINSPRDYDLNTGLIDPSQQSTVFMNTRMPGAAKQSYVYIANECVSEFNKGKFVQTIKGSLMTYYPDQTAKINQQIGQQLQIEALTALTQSRFGSGFNLGSLTSPSFLNNLPTLGQITTAATGFALDASGRFVNTVLGDAATRISATPTAPTSSGLDIGTDSTEGPVLLNQTDDQFAGDTTGTEQNMASGDDAGGPELLNIDTEF